MIGGLVGFDKYTVGWGLVIVRWDSGLLWVEGLFICVWGVWRCLWSLVCVFVFWVLILVVLVWLFVICFDYVLLALSVIDCSSGCLLLNSVGYMVMYLTVCLCFFVLFNWLITGLRDGW